MSSEGKKINDIASVRAALAEACEEREKLRDASRVVFEVLPEIIGMAYSGYSVEDIIELLIANTYVFGARKRFNAVFRQYGLDRLLPALGASLISSSMNNDRILSKQTARAKRIFRRRIAAASAMGGN